MKTRILAGATAAALLLLAAGCGSKGARTNDTGSAAGGKLTLGASLSLSGSLVKEGKLTQEGYDVCVKVVNDKGGVPVGGKKYTLEISYQDDTSKPDTAGQIVDQFNNNGIKVILGPYGSATTEAAAAVVERNGQVMADSAGADDKIFAKGYQRTFAVLSPAKAYVASMVQSVYDLATPRPVNVAFISADDGFSNEGVAIVKQAKELGVNPSGGFAETVAPPTPDFVKTLGASAEGVLGSTQWTVKTAGKDKWFGSATDYNKTFAAQFGGREPEYHNAEATAACLALVLAVEKAGSTDPTKVRDALSTMDEQSFFGPLKFTPQGQNLTKKMGVIQIQGGKQVAVWPADASEAPLKWPGTKA